MRVASKRTLIGATVALAVVFLLVVRQAPTGAAPPRVTAKPALPGLPARSTPTPSGTAPPGLSTALPAPALTSPFAFPTQPPDLSPTPRAACTAVFPIESVERIEFGVTSIPQLEAAFGRATSRGGRPPRLRFESNGCTLVVMLSGQEAVEAELLNYGSLGWLLDRYGQPEAVGVSQGNLVLLALDNTLLLYPEEGILARFDVDPADLKHDTPISHLIFRPAFEAEKQITRLNLLPIEDWLPPLR